MAPGGGSVTDVLAELLGCDLSRGATGLLLASLHAPGLATLTDSPSSMGFLKEILGRPENERPFVLIPVGYPTEDAEVPDIALQKKPLEDVTEFV